MAKKLTAAAARKLVDEINDVGYLEIDLYDIAAELADAKRATRNQIADHWRLACQTKVKNDLKIQVPEEVFGVKEWECEVVSNHNVATFIKEFVVKLPEGEVLDFKPGSYIQITVPKGFFELAKLGPDHYSPITRYKLFADSYLESYVGLSKRLGDRLTLGAKVKLMVGLGSAGMTVDRFEVVSGEEVLMADVKTRLDLHARGLRQNVKEKVDFEAYWDGLSYDWRNAGLAGAGVAVDLGAEFRLTDRMRLSAALTDIGFMGWTKRSAVRGESDGLVEFTGLEIDIDDDDSVNDQLDDLKDRFLTMLQYQEAAR